MARSVFSWALVLLFAALFLVNVAHVRGEDEDAPKEEKPTEDSDSTKTDDEEVDGDVLRAASDIVTTVYFPEFPDKKFQIGGDVTVLVGIANKGKEDYNMSYIGASLHNPFDLAYHIQNFTWRVADGTVEAGTEQTFEYSFRPDQRLEPLTFWLTAFIGYNNTDTGVPYQSYFHNSTIELVEKPSDMNARRVFTYFLALAAAGLVGYFAFNSLSPKSSSSSSGAERGTRDDGRSSSAAASWVPAKVYAQAASSKVAGRKGKAKPSSAASPKAADK